MISAALGFCAGAISVWLIQRLKLRRLELWQLNNIDGNIEFKTRFIEKISDVHKLLSQIAAGTKNRYSKPAKRLIDYIDRGINYASSSKAE